MAARRRPGTSTIAVAATLVTVLLTLVAGGSAQDGFPFRDFPNPVPYAPLPERPRAFQRDVQHQAYQQHAAFQPPFHQPPFQNKFQSPLQQPFQLDAGAYELEQKHPYTRNATGFPAFQARPFQTTPQVGPRPDDAPGAFFPDPHFEQLFQRELNHQIQLEHQRLQEQRHQNAPSFQIQQSVQVERPQLQELQQLHSLLEQQLQMHEVRHNAQQVGPGAGAGPPHSLPHSLLEQQQQRQQQEMLQAMIRQQQQQQQNLVDSHEIFMSQKIKPQGTPAPPVRRPPQPPPPPPQKQRQTPKPSLTTTTTPRAPLEVIDLSQFLPFLQQQQQEQLAQHIQQQKQAGKDKPQESVREQQRLRQQQRQQETLRQQEERRQQEQRHRERQRQQRQQLQQEQEKRQKAQQQGAGRQQRQQPTNNNINNNSGNRTTAEKPVTSVRDLFNTSSCIEPPLTCPHPRIHFYLYTRTTQAEGQKIDVTKPESLIHTQFNPKHPIKVLIHGFQGGRQFSPSTDLRKAYFIRGDYNIFVVDYNSLVRLPCLSQIQWSPSFLALCVSQLVTYVGTTTASVTGTRVPPDRFHLIGYSIGAHIAGLVANYIERDQGKLGRITGLDPTIIFYQGANRSQDLDPSDAHFIDVIHTGAGILGQRGPNGHVDYYVNGGTTQPGCQSDSLIKTLSCDHTKVSPYYVESIVTPVGFWALPCPNLFMYLLGFCQPKDEDYILMGEDAPHTARGIYYLSTNANKPYAKGFPGKKMPIKFPKWRPN